MKRLTLMRHAEARWKDAGLSDLERPLNRRGTAAAEAMARRLLELQLLPDLLLVSPAVRTRQTADIVARELSLPARRVLHARGRSNSCARARMRGCRLGDCCGV